MNTPQNHHFIPKVYLKEFANRKKELFQLSKGYSKTSIKLLVKFAISLTVLNYPLLKVCIDMTFFVIML